MTDPDDLLRMLDLGGADDADVAGDGLSFTPAEPDHVAHDSPTALDLDEWALRKGRDVLAESDKMRSLGLTDFEAADFFACAYLPDPTLLDGCVDPRRHEFVAQLLDTPEYHALHATTTLHEAASVIAAHAFAEQFAALKKADEHTSSDGGGVIDREMATLRAVGRALTKAADEVEEAVEATRAMGMGEGSPGTNDPKAIAALYRRVRNNPTLRRICDMAGRYRRLAQSKQRQKTTHGMDDVVGVELSGDISKLLPVELAKLAVPELELDTLRRLVEGRCMAREYRGVEPVAKGPVIVCCDESGSMEGEKNHTSKALALAMAWVARRQRRWIGLLAYSGDSGERLLPLPPGRWDESALLDWLAAFIGRGSSLDVPVREMPLYYDSLKAPKGRTDVLFLTDAKVCIPSEIRDRFLAWKLSAHARLISLVIGGEPGDLVHISDETHRIQSLSVEEVAVGRVLSV